MKDYSIIKSQYLKDISSAITSKGGPSGPMYPKDMANNIMNLPSGSGSGSSNVGKSYINFYDYNGTLLYSWTEDELDNKTELPELPSHDGLICQGWNYTLSQIKDQNNPVNVGAMYITDDGCTRIKLVIAEDARLTQPLMFMGNVEIDWGDGSSKETYNNTSYNTINHTYSSKGEYLISIRVLSGTLSLGGNSSSYNICGSTTNSSISPSRVYSSRIRDVNIGSNVTSIGGYAFYYCYHLSSITIPNSVTSIGTYAFSCCYSLSSVTIPNSVTSIGGNAFSSCYSLYPVTIPNSVTGIGTYAFYCCYHLSSVTIPNSVTSIGTYAFSCCYHLSSFTIPNRLISISSYIFYYCYSLTSVTIPNIVTSISTYAFQYCYSLSSVTIPNSVTRIGTYAFYNCYGITEYDFTSHTKVPTLSNTNAFTGIANDCKICVPNSLYNEWISATNWVTYKDYIVGVN